MNNKETPMEIINLFLTSGITLIISALLGFLFLLWGIRFFWSSSYNEAKINLINAIRFLEQKDNKLSWAPTENKNYKRLIHPYILGSSQDNVFTPQRSVKTGRILTSTPLTEIMYLPRDDRSNMPSILTSIGIIGTFLGITLALQDLDSFQAGNDLQDMMSGAVTLISGMKIAFLTSLVGLCLAAIVLLSLSYQRNKRNKDEQELFEQLAKLLEEANMIEALHHIASPEKIEADKASIKAAQSMQQAATAMNQSLSGFNADIIADRVGDAITSTLNQNMLPVFTSMNESLSHIQQRMENQNEDILNAMITDLRDKVISPMSDTVIDSTMANKDLTTAVSSLQDGLVNVTSSLESTVEHINSSAKHLVEQSQKLLESKNDVMELVEMVGLNKAASFSKLEQIAKHLHGTVSHLDQNYNAVQASITSLKDGIAFYIKEAEQHQLKFYKEYDQHSDKLFQSILESADTIAASIEDAKKPEL